MAEIRLNEAAFKAQVEAFRVAAKQIEAEYIDVSGGDKLSLDTADAYRERFNGRLKDISNIIGIFGMLAEKDADDMDKIAETLKAADMADVTCKLDVGRDITGVIPKTANTNPMAPNAEIPKGASRVITGVKPKTANTEGK